MTDKYPIYHFPESPPEKFMGFHKSVYELIEIQSALIEHAENEGRARASVNIAAAMKRIKP